MSNLDPYTSSPNGIVTHESVEIQLRVQTFKAKDGSTKTPLNINSGSLLNWWVQILSSVAPNFLFCAAHRGIIFYR